MMSDGGMWFGGGFMWIFWILIIAAVIWLLKMVSDNSFRNRKPDDDGPLEILEKRYARGEIEEEEYQRRRKELEG